MPNSKQQAPTKAPVAPTQQVERRPETPAKQSTPGKAAPVASTVGVDADRGAGAPMRARMASGMQRQVGNARINRTLALSVQAKLIIGAPNDRHEQEADHIAKSVVDTSDQVKPEAKTLPRHVMAKAQDDGLRGSPAVEQKINGSRGNGQSLPKDVRSPMESAMGADFSRVNIHTGSDAIQTNRELGAQAFTHGSDIYFDEGKYDPNSPSGKRLLAHELTHVVQQKPSSSAEELTRNNPASPAEQEIASRAASVFRGNSLPQVSRMPIQIARQEKEGSPAQSAEATSDQTSTPPTDAGVSPPTTNEPTDASLPATATPQSGTDISRQSSVGSNQPPQATTGPKAVTSQPPGIAPDVPALPKITITCPVNTQQDTEQPREKEIPPALPVLSEADFDGDVQISDFADALARCWAQRLLANELKKRYQSNIDQARAAAKERAKFDEMIAILKATKSVEPLGENPSKADKKSHDHAVFQAQRAARIQADHEAKQKIEDAVNAVARPDPTLVEAELEQDKLVYLAENFKATMGAVLKEYGVQYWQPRALKRLNAARAAQWEVLNAKPRIKKGQTPPPIKTEEEKKQELEAFMQPLRCREDEWIQNNFQASKHAWMVGRREFMDAQTRPQPDVKAMAPGFAPPRDVPVSDWVQIPPELKHDKDSKPVAPEVVGFLRWLQKFHAHFKVDNYKNHGLGAWQGKGFSLDIYLDDTVKKDARGFWEHHAAVDFLLKLNIAALISGAEWRVLYNDNSVKEEVNRQLGVRRVEFVGTVFDDKSVNYHGPDPLKLHFHLDIAPKIRWPITP